MDFCSNVLQTTAAGRWIHEKGIGGVLDNFFGRTLLETNFRLEFFLAVKDSSFSRTFPRNPQKIV